jgi:hypothetical protein
MEPLHVTLRGRGWRWGWLGGMVLGLRHKKIILCAGQLYRFHCRARGSFCWRGEENAGRENEATRAGRSSYYYIHRSLAAISVSVSSFPFAIDFNQCSGSHLVRVLHKYFKKQCCESGHGIRCFFDCWIRNGNKSGSGMNIPDTFPEKQFLG